MRKRVVLYLVLSLLLAMSILLVACSKEETPTLATVVSVTVTPKTGEIKVDETITLTAEIETTGYAAKTIQWSVNNSTRATVENGVVTALSVGTVEVTAMSTADSIKRDTDTITITSDTKLEVVSVLVTPKMENIQVGKTT